MLRHLSVLLVSVLISGLSLLAAAEPPLYRTLSGEIEGAHWAALVPENWTGRLLLEAPDRREPPQSLAANLDAAQPANAELLAAGWAIATTSYRRHGPLIADGIADLRALRDHLVEELGPPKLTVIEGTGMGGLIALFIAERHADEFHGCIALDPPLDLRDPRALRLRYDHQPRAPLLLLSTSATAESIQAYIARARTSANAESVVPVFWFVPDASASADPLARRREALDAMGNWAQTRQPPAERPVPAGPSADADVSGDEVPAGEPAPANPRRSPQLDPTTPAAPAATTASPDTQGVGRGDQRGPERVAPSKVG